MKSQFETVCKYWVMSFTFIAGTLLSGVSFAQTTDQLHEYLNPFRTQSAETHLYREITDADATLENRLQLIEKAQQSIIIESSVLRKDDTGVAVLKALLSKASSMNNVIYVRDEKTPPKKVLLNPKTGKSFLMRLLVDYQTSGGDADIDLHTAKLLRDAGIEVRYFHVPIVGLLQTYRDHRNLMIADDEVCVSGGQISDNYFPKNQQARDLCLQGKILRPALKNFYAYWYLQDGTYAGHFAEIPKDPVAPVIGEHLDIKDAKLAQYSLGVQLKNFAKAKSHAQALLSEDPELNQKIQARRQNGQAILNATPWKVSNSVSFYSDLLGSDKKAERVSAYFAANNGTQKLFDIKCTGSMDLTFAKAASQSDLMICIDDKLTGAVAAPVIVPRPVSSQVDLTKGRVVDIQARYRFKPEKQECIDSNADPFDPGAYMKDGADKGACANTSELRVPVILGETDKTITIANFRHGRRFWVATIDKTAIDEVYFLNGTFGGKILGFIAAAHSQLRFIMNKNSPILLQEQKVGSKEVQYITEFDVSAEPYNVRDKNGHDDDRIITRFASVMERSTDEMAFRWRMYTDQIELKLNSEQRSHLLKTSIYRSVSQGYTRYYSMWDSNCAVEAVKTVSMAFPPKNGEAASAIITLLNAVDPVIGPTTKAMKVLGLANEESASFTMEDEFSSPIDLMLEMRRLTPDVREQKKLDSLLDDAQKGIYVEAHSKDLDTFK
jgi:hypothetical protein